MTNWVWTDKKPTERVQNSWKATKCFICDLHQIGEWSNILLKGPLLQCSVCGHKEYKGKPKQSHLEAFEEIK